MKKKILFGILCAIAFAVAAGVLFFLSGESGSGESGSGETVPTVTDTETEAQTETVPTDRDTGSDATETENKRDDPPVPAECVHDYGEWDTVRIPDEQSDGLRRRICRICGEAEEEILPALPAHKHEYTTTTLLPTCTEDGYTVHICACGVTVQTDRTPATGHSFGEWETVSEPAGGNPGYREHTCLLCGDRYGEDFFLDPAEGGHEHDYTYWSEVIPPTCTYPGYSAVYCICGSELRSDFVPATGHQWGEWEETLAPDGTRNGVEQQMCDLCCDIRSRTVFAPDQKKTPKITNEVEYLCQRDDRWGSIALGCGTVGRNGCAPTAVAMALHLYGVEVTPGEVCTWLYKNTAEFNSSFHGTSGSGIRLLAEHYGREVLPIVTEEEFREHLAAGAAVVGAQGYGYFSSQVNGSHGILILAGSEDGKCLCYDPYYLTKCGEYDLTEIWNQRSKIDVDLRFDGVTHYAIY